MPTPAKTLAWTWTGSPITGWKAQLRKGFIDPQKPLVPSSITIHRRDGAASQHTVLALIQPGSNPLVKVNASGTPAPGYPTPTSPAVRWKHSKLRSRCRHNGTKATVFRIRKNGDSMWTYHTMSNNATTSNAPQPANPPSHPTFPTRQAALKACEKALLEPITLT